MFMHDEDDLFGGSPEGKYFDIIFNANRNLVKNELINNLEKIAALELLLEEILGEDKDIERIIQNFILEHQDQIESRKNDLFIEGMGNILTQNE